MDWVSQGMLPIKYASTNCLMRQLNFFTTQDSHRVEVNQTALSFEGYDRYSNSGICHINNNS